MPTPQYSIQNSQALQQQMAAQYQPQAPPYQVFYPGQNVIAQPQRPPSGSVIQTTAAQLQKRERKPIKIIDPNSGQEVHSALEAEAAAAAAVAAAASNKTSPSGSARSTPVGRESVELEGSSPPPNSSNIAAQFAAQVAATLRPGHSAPASSDNNYTSAAAPEVLEIYDQAVEVTEPIVESTDVQLDNSAEKPETLPETLVVETPVVVEDKAPEPAVEADVGSSVDYSAPETTSPVEEESSAVDATIVPPSEIVSSLPPVQEPTLQEPTLQEPTLQEPTLQEPTVQEQPVLVEEVAPEVVADKPEPAVVSVAHLSKEPSPAPVNDVAEVKQLEDSISNFSERQKNDKKKPKEILNLEGDEKRGTDMDAELEGPKPSVVPEVSVTPASPAVVMGVKEEESSAPKEVNNIDAINKENEVPKVEIEIKNVEETEISRQNDKNEAKTNEATTEESVVNAVDNKKSVLKYNYKEDQWSPLNPEGKMQYDRDFLLQLQYAKDSMKKPESLPNLPEIIPDKVQPPSKPMEMRNYSHVPDFTPGFFRPARGQISGGGRSGSMPKRGSQQRDIKVIKHVSIQLDEKLHRAKDAWKSGHGEEKPKEKEEGLETVTEVLYKRVRSILNKLTPQKFQTLIKQVQGLVIDTEERLTGVTDIIFEKAISEPGFSVAYANMCRYLLTLKVTADNKPGETVNFRVILLTRCQREFLKDNDFQIDVEKRKKAIEEAESAEKKTELKEELKQAATKAKRRSIGNIRFIGELFKLKMLTEKIMHDCVFKLLRSRDEENLECLCRLLATIGKELETDKAKPRMDQYFQQMNKIVSDKKVSSRCRFMLQDVIDLRTSNWKPRRDENNPKTIDQIHKDAKREAVEQNMLTALHISQQPQQQHHQSRQNKPTRGRPQGDRLGMGGSSGGPTAEDGWNTVSSKAIRNIDRNLDVSKLRIEKNADENIQLGPARGFGGWGRGSSGGGSQTSKEGEKQGGPINRFTALNKEDDQRSRAFGRGISPARGDSRNRAGGFNRGPSISKRPSQEMERASAIASARNLVSGRTTPPSGASSREGSRTRAPRERTAPATKEYTEEEIDKKTRSIMDEYLHIKDTKEAIDCVKELNSPQNLHFFVYYAINNVLERSTIARQQTGHLLHDLINKDIISVDTYLRGLTEILQSAEDMEIDIPKIWLYLGELIGPMIQDGSVPLSFLNKACEPLKSAGKAGHLMAEILHDASQRLGHNTVAHLWRNNCMDWSFFVAKDKIQQFLQDKKLEFTVSPDSAPSTPTNKISIDWVKENLMELLLRPKCDNEQMFEWIEKNIPEDITKENKFIRALMTSVCSSAIVGTAPKVDEVVMKKWSVLLLKYLDHQPVFELQAIYALQALVHSLEHPPGVLRTFFDTLYDEEIISEDAFNQWETSQDEPEGKGVALKQVVQFFTWLREGEEEEADS